MTELVYVDDRQRAWRSARAMTFMNFVLSSVVITGWYVSHHLIYNQWIVAAATNLFFYLVIRKDRRLPTAIYGTVYIGAVVIALFAHSVTNYQLAQGNVRFDSFAGYKIVPFAVAILTPYPIWIGFFVVSMCAIVPVILFFGLFTESMRASLPIQEPWLSMLYGITALFILHHRLKNIRAEREVARIRAEQKAIGDIAHIFLGLRDLTNTPLQAIELTAHLLCKHQMTQDEGAKFLEASLIQLRELSEILLSYEKDVDWTKIGSSFDAVPMLQKKLRMLNPVRPV